MSINHILRCSESLDALIQRIDPKNEQAALSQVLIRSVDSSSDHFEVKKRGFLASIGRFFTRLFAKDTTAPYDLQTNLERLSKLFSEASTTSDKTELLANSRRLNAFAAKVEAIRDRAIVSLSQDPAKIKDPANCARIERLNSIQFTRFATGKLVDKPYALQARPSDAKPIESVTPEPTAAPIPVTIEIAPRRRGYVVRIVGRERVKFWLPIAGALVGLLLGFYIANLVANYQTFASVSQQTRRSELLHAASQLESSCRTCDADLNFPTPPAGLDIDHIVASLRELQQGARQNQRLLNELSRAAAHEASTVRTAQVAKTAMSFAQTALIGDVPLKLFSKTNMAGAMVGACIGLVIMKQISNYLERE